MKTQFETVEITKIYFESGDSNVYVNSTIKKENLSCPTEMIVSFSDLNLIINKLQQINPESDISAFFEEEKMYDGSLLYTLNSKKHQGNSFFINQLEFNHSIKQIRA
ncbi:MAG: hypothetical protein HYR91_00365 [Flavobacteriia bacterium]|nr:hypothetical protein [Flavobacteriia bacterium]